MNEPLPVGLLRIYDGHVPVPGRCFSNLLHHAPGIFPSCFCHCDVNLGAAVVNQAAVGVHHRQLQPQAPGHCHVHRRLHCGVAFDCSGGGHRAMGHDDMNHRRDMRRSTVSDEINSIDLQKTIDTRAR